MHPIKTVGALSHAAVNTGVESPLASRMLSRWHLLSLDAPTVAAVWTWFVARSTRVDLPWQSVAAMFIAVWVLYAADRLLDARGTVGLEERHLFHRQHGGRFRWGIAGGCVALALLLPQLSPAAVRLYLVLGVLLVAWFVIIHSIHSIHSTHSIYSIHAINLIDTDARPLPKEFVVGMFFAAAVFVPVVARRPELQRELILPAIAFGVLCSLNCLFIFSWEHERLGEVRGNRLTLLAARWVVWLGAWLGVGCLLGWENSIVRAVGISAGLLVGAHLVRGRVERTTLRAVADLVLLTPLVVAWWR